MSMWVPRSLVPPAMLPQIQAQPGSRDLGRSWDAGSRHSHIAVGNPHFSQENQSLNGYVMYVVRRTLKKMEKLCITICNDYTMFSLFDRFQGCSTASKSR